MTLHRDIVEVGDELPCHKQNIVHMEELKFEHLVVWWDETEGSH